MVLRPPRPIARMAPGESVHHLAVVYMLLLSVLGCFVLHRMLTFIINILEANIKVDYIGTVTNTGQY